MNEIKINKRFEWWESAHDEFRQSMELAGFHIYGVSVGKGCHWGEFYTDDETFEKIKELIAQHTVIVTNHRKYYISLYTDALGNTYNKFFFSITKNKDQ